MFEWKVEDGILLRKKPDPITNKFVFEDSVGYKDKLGFCDKMLDGRVSYVIDLAKKFREDAETLPKDSYGCVKTVSLKSWLNKNDSLNIVDKNYRYGSICLCKNLDTDTKVYLDSAYIQSFNENSAYSLVEKVFHELLVKCHSLEVKYYNEHDEYSVLMNKFQDMLRCGKAYTFGRVISYGTDGIFIRTKDENGKFDKERRLTLQELKAFLDYNEQVQEFVDVLSQSFPVDYNKPIGELKNEKEIITR